MIIRVQEADFDVGLELAAMTRGRHGVGGLASFVGLVRDIADGTGVSAMTLEHYPGMTERELGRIAEEAKTRWPLDDVLIIHRHGRLEPGERIVLCAASAAHRQAAFEACMFLVDWLKTKAPFWKLEASGGDARWLEGRESDDAAARRWQPAEGG